MELVHSNIDTARVEEKPVKRVPKYKDPVFMAGLMKAWIAENNAKIRARKANNS